MAKKGASPKKGGKKAAKKAAPALKKLTPEEEAKKEEEYNNMVNIPEHGWVKIDMRIVNWKFNFFQFYVKSNDCLSKIHAKIIERHGRVDNIRIYQNEPNTESEVKKDDEDDQEKDEPLTDMDLELHELFDSFGDKKKSNAPEF